MPNVFRNNLVFANNKIQNIEYRIFATGSARLKTGSLAIAYSSFFNKFISDLPVVSTQISPNYYASESKASNVSNYLIYQNTRSIYLQNLNLFVAEYASTASLNDTGSYTVILNTNYYTSESKAAVTSDYLIYQNSRSIYLQNLNLFVAEYASSVTLTETGSNSLILNTNYYVSESKASNASNYLIYQNTRSIYLQNLNLFVAEYASTASLNDTGSYTLTLGTNYYTSESKASNVSNYLIYQNTRSIYLENLNLFVTEYASTASLNDTGSYTLTLGTNYYVSESKASSTSNYLIYQNTRSIYLENSDLLIIES